ncbi:MAG: protochlorophyllide oxidoreductase [Chlorobiaceae bacterium]|nr:protochlorophyllide oxidoreductase [Chlorobiaceae bacterium]
MTRDKDRQMKAIILYDSRSRGGATDRLIDSIGQQLAEYGAYVEKARCKATADYSFLRDFDVVIMGAPVYYMVVSSQLLGALLQSNLKRYLKNKNIALFLTCGSPVAMAQSVYLPQLKIHLMRNRILSEKIIAPHQIDDEEVIEDFVEEIVDGYRKSFKSRGGDLQWSDEALELLDSAPPFFSDKIRAALISYAEENGIRYITPEVLDEARASPRGY